MVCIYRRQNSTHEKKPPQYSARERARVYDIEYSVVVKHEYVRNCVHSHNYTRSQRSNKKRERASDWVRVLNANGMLLNTQAQYTVRVSYTQREKKKCEKQSGPKSFAYNSRYYNNNNNRTAAELKYQIYLNVRRICCAMCYAFTSVARVIKHIIHLTRASTNGLRNQTKEWTNVHTYVRTYQPNNLTAKPMVHEIYRNHSNMCEHSGKKKKTKTVLIHQMTNFFYQF